jgi:hypothetical protein
MRIGDRKGQARAASWDGSAGDEERAAAAARAAVAVAVEIVKRHSRHKAQQCCELGRRCRERRDPREVSGAGPLARAKQDWRRLLGRKVDGGSVKVEMLAAGSSWASRQSHQSCRREAGRQNRSQQRCRLRNLWITIGETPSS